MTLQAKLEETATSLRAHYPYTVQAVGILGSGLGDLADTVLQNAVKIPFNQIPHFPVSTVEGHSGNVCLGQLANGQHVALLQGRVHFYEGHSMADVVYPLRALKMLGAKTLLVTNAAGGINPQFASGDIMLITDHINFQGTNPLIGQNIAGLGPRFPDMSAAYTPALQQLALENARELGMTLRQGVYVGVTGPSYETPAEIRMFTQWGGDAVGMSTVSEVIVAAHMGMQVLGFSCITNAAAGIQAGHTLNHQEVLEAAQSAKAHFAQLVTLCLLALAHECALKDIS